MLACMQSEMCRAQVNTPTRLALVSVAFLYVGLIVILPFGNIFIQVQGVAGC